MLKKKEMNHAKYEGWGKHFDWILLNRVGELFRWESQKRHNFKMYFVWIFKQDQLF